MAIHSLENNHYKPSFTSSYPFFNYALLGKDNFELNIPESFSLAKISQTIQEKLGQDVDLNGDLGLFSVPEALKTSGPCHRDVSSGEPKAPEASCGDLASSMRSKLSARRGVWSTRKAGKSAIRAKIMSKQGRSGKSSPKKTSTMNAQKNSMNIPSFADLFSDEERNSASVGDGAFSLGAARYVGIFEEDGEFDALSETDESVGMNLGRKCIKSREKFLDEPFENFDYDAPLFVAENIGSSYPRQDQMSRKWTKKLKSNPSEMTFQAFNIFGEYSGGQKQDNFDFALEQIATSTSYSQMDAKLIEGSTFGI